ncbi:hypothetical protein [Sphingobacterium pedocola]|uniref:Uncharacterized protein n=1 Tax=Sphingobacterium pedocola TaxID=2082722 RepID=A0ABR9T8C5_9SPHI|nr:hypothetical protein [Sphingobacterium pedocola]MBE8721257.1 hypothetical protein [Sphingobacterium pedocola]
MATNKRLTDLTAYKSVLPYASEIFGVYQPLIGWKGKRNTKRFIWKPKLIPYVPTHEEKYRGEFTDRLDNTTIPFNHYLKMNGDERAGKMPDDLLFYENIRIQTSAESKTGDAVFLDVLRANITDEAEIENVFSKDSYQQILDAATDTLYANYKENFVLTKETSSEYYYRLNNDLLKQAHQASQASSKLMAMFNARNIADIKAVIFNKTELIIPKQYIENPFESFDPTQQLQRVGLSPIGIVHLFRQYFYELDTFLGTPVGHVWLSPGSSVELIESSTRKTLIERTSEIFQETIYKTESSLTEKDELSEAVKSENENSIKFGANVTAEQKWVWGEASQSASFDLGTTQKTARENTHGKMREQSSKLSSEIRKNYKSTFKTVSETTDVSSKRMVLNNTSMDLVNYELRRKMRQVAVQVQDIGTYLCWQTFVDRPGDALGLSTLVHIAQKPDGQIPQPPAEIPTMQPFSNQEIITIDCIPTTKKGIEEFDGNALDETYVICQEHGGSHLKEDNGHEYVIRRYHEVVLIPKNPGYKLIDLRFVANPDVSLSTEIESATGTVKITLNTINFRDKTSIALNAESVWEVDKTSPYYLDLEQKRIDAQKVYDNAVRKEHESQFIQAARERIKLANGIQTRKYEELREEERIVVYRQLIRDLGKDVVYNKDETEKKTSQKEADSDFHVFYELLNSIFDIDKMLYFVAPEWWRAKPVTQLNVGTDDGSDSNSSGTLQDAKTIIPRSNFATWGEPRHNNYFITDDQPYPAKLGSSLGWLLQMDGDNLRNAFLNSPWVKAVMPIRPGKEKEALNWLKHVEGMNGISENDMYQGPEESHRGKTLLQVLEDLAEKVKQKHKASIESRSFPADDEDLINSIDPETKEIIDDRNIVSSTPIDRVYEHGFYPLQEGFRAEVDKDFQIFDQWIEVLPTDQVVPVEVVYDPKTGRQK